MRIGDPAQGRNTREMSELVTGRVRKSRARQRKTRLKLVQLWLPDASKPEFVAECRRQAAVIANSSEEQRISRELELWFAELPD